MKSLQFVLTTLLLATTVTACATSDTESTDDAEATEASDLATAQRHLRCNLEYARYSPDFLTLPAGSFDELMTKVTAEGATTSDGKFAFEAHINPTPPYNLPFQLAIRDLST